MKDIIVMCPTVERANYEFKRFCGILKERASRIRPVERRVDVLGGPRVFFKGETEGQKAVIGYHAVVISIEEFKLGLEDFYYGQDKTDS